MRVTPDELRPSVELLKQVQEYLDERRLLSTVLVVSEPAYVWASVEAEVKIRRGASVEDTQRAVEDKLYRYIHPIQGGSDGAGWPFGRGLFASELFSQVQTVEDVEYVSDVRMFPVNPETGERGEQVHNIELQPDALLCSHIHDVSCF
jgi:hypothetical protein